MIGFGGTEYYIDIDKICEYIKLESKDNSNKNITSEVTTTYDESEKILSKKVVKTTSDKTQEIDGIKYEMIRTMLDTILAHFDEIDETLGSERALDKMPLPIKISFNTLLSLGVIRENNENN